jgi:hypothetical protein
MLIDPNSLRFGGQNPCYKLEGDILRREVALQDTIYQTSAREAELKDTQAQMQLLPSQVQLARTEGAIREEQLRLDCLKREEEWQEACSKREENLNRELEAGELKNATTCLRLSEPPTQSSPSPMEGIIPTEKVLARTFNLSKGSEDEGEPKKYIWIRSGKTIQMLTGIVEAD